MRQKSSLCARAERNSPIPQRSQSLNVNYLPPCACTSTSIFLPVHSGSVFLGMLETRAGDWEDAVQAGCSNSAFWFLRSTDSSSELAAICCWTINLPRGSAMHPMPIGGNGWMLTRTEKQNSCAAVWFSWGVLCSQSPSCYSLPPPDLSEPVIISFHLSCTASPF